MLTVVFSFMLYNFLEKLYIIFRENCILGDDELNVEEILLIEAAHLRKPPRIISIRNEDNPLSGVGGYSVSAQPVKQVCSTL